MLKVYVTINSKFLVTLSDVKHSQWVVITLSTKSKIAHRVEKVAENLFCKLAVAN